MLKLYQIPEIYTTVFVENLVVFCLSVAKILNSLSLGDLQIKFSCSGAAKYTRWFSAFYF